LLAVTVYLLMPGEVPHPAKLTAATAVLMAVWWMTEALPIPATALVPLVLFPVLSPEVGFDDVGASYGNNIIFLFMGGFMLALAMQRWNLHKRIALAIVGSFGASPALLVLGFMAATGFISMWVSNTATAVMMLPIGVSVLLLVSQLREAEKEIEAEGTATQETDDERALTSSDASEVVKSKFGISLMLGIAYAASIGSLATIIGTPPNAILVGHMSQNHGVTIGFGHWMIVGAPIAVVFMLIAWLLLTKVLYKPEITEIPGGAELIRSERRKLGPISSGAGRVTAGLVSCGDAAVARAAADGRRAGAQRPVRRRRSDRMDRRGRRRSGRAPGRPDRGDRRGRDPVPDGADLEHRDRCDVPAGGHGGRHRHRYRSDAAGDPGGDRGHLRVHATGRDPAQCHRLRLRVREHPADGQGRNMAEPDRDRPDQHGHPDPRSVGVRSDLLTPHSRSAPLLVLDAQSQQHQRGSRCDHGQHHRDRRAPAPGLVHQPDAPSQHAG